jgi:hypothetical protein
MGDSRNVVNNELRRGANRKRGEPPQQRGILDSSNASPYLPASDWHSLTQSANAHQI